MTRPTYDPMRPASRPFPRHRFARVADDARVEELAAAYAALPYDEQYRWSRQVASAPDERLVELGEEMVSADPEAPPPAEPVPAADPSAPAINQEAAQVNPDVTPPDANPAPTPPPLPVPAEQLPQLTVPRLQRIASDVGVARGGTKDELVSRIVAATGEQAAVTPEQVAADAAAQPTEDSPAPEQPAAEPVTAPPAPADAASAPQEPADAAAQADTPAPAAPGADSPQVAPATPAAPAAGTPTTGGATP